MNLLAKTAPAGIWTRVPAPRATEQTAPEWAVTAARLAASFAAGAAEQHWRRPSVSAVAVERASQRTSLHRQYRCSHSGHDGGCCWSVDTDGLWARCSMTTSTRQQHPASQAGPLNSAAIAPLLSRRRTRSTTASTHSRLHNIDYWAPQNSATGCCC